MYEDLNSRWINKTLWNYLFIVELLRAEYGDSASAWSNIGKWFKGDTKRINRLIESGVSATGSYSNRFLELVDEVKLSGGVGVVNGEVSLSRKDAKKNTASKGNILHDLNSVASQLNNLVDHRYLILLDDLDLNWTNDIRHKELLEALVSSVHQLSRSGKVSFVVAIPLCQGSCSLGGSDLTRGRASEHYVEVLTQIQRKDGNSGSRVWHFD